MSVKPVLKMGDPALLQVSKPLIGAEFDELPVLLEDMFDTMHALDGAGLAAPQIGVAKRVVIFGIENNPRYPDVDAVPTTVLVNPQIEVLNETEEMGWEGCLSVPGMRGLVPRPKGIRYQGIDENGKTIDRQASGFHARVVLHEVDHLDGVLYPMRIKDLRNLGFEDTIEWQSSCDP